MPPKREKTRLGWREWVGLPGLSIPKIKAKIDTGARTSSLHAYEIALFTKGREKWVKFKVHPSQKDTQKFIAARAKVLDHRPVKSSTGHVQQRVVILTDLTVGNQTFEIELTLTNRDMMGFRMLIGRQALRRKFIINPGVSYLVSKRKMKKKSKETS